MGERIVDVPGHGPAKVMSVGGAHSSAIDVVVGRAGVRFEFQLDEALRGRLVRVPFLHEPPAGDLRPLAQAAQDYLEGEVTSRLFLTLGRIEMDSDDLKREIHDVETRVKRMRSEPTANPDALARAQAAIEVLGRRVADLLGYKSALQEWSRSPDRSAGLPLPVSTLLPLPTPSEGPAAIGRALASGEVSSLPNDALNGPVAEAIRLSLEAGHPMVGFSQMKHPALYPGLVNKDPRFAPSIRPTGSLAWMAKDGLVTNDDLVVVECRPPMAYQAALFARRLIAAGLDPVMVAFDAAGVHVGKASRLIEAMGRKPSVEAVSDQVRELLLREAAGAGITLGRYMEIVDEAARRHGLDGDDVSIDFQERHGHAFSIQLASPPGL